MVTDGFPTGFCFMDLQAVVKPRETVAIHLTAGGLVPAFLE